MQKQLRYINKELTKANKEKKINDLYRKRTEAFKKVVIEAEQILKELENK